MSGEIQIKYEDVYGKAAGLRSKVTAEIDCMEGEYVQIQSMLDGVDGAANAALKAAMEANKEKTRISLKTLDKLISFMDNSSRQVETSEHRIKDILAAILNFFRGGKH